MQPTGLHRISPISDASNNPAKEQKHQRASGNIRCITWVKLLELTAAFVNPAIYIVFAAIFFAVSVISMWTSQQVTRRSNISSEIQKILCTFCRYIHFDFDKRHTNKFLEYIFESFGTCLKSLSQNFENLIGILPWDFSPCQEVVLWWLSDISSQKGCWVSLGFSLFHHSPPPYSILSHVLSHHSYLQRQNFLSCLFLDCDWHYSLSPPLHLLDGLHHPAPPPRRLVHRFPLQQKAPQSQVFGIQSSCRPWCCYFLLMSWEKKLLQNAWHKISFITLQPLWMPRLQRGLSRFSAFSDGWGIFSDSQSWSCNSICFTLIELLGNFFPASLSSSCPLLQPIMLKSGACCEDFKTWFDVWHLLLTALPSHYL